MTTYGQTLYVLEKQKKEKPKESFQDLIIKAKEYTDSLKSKKIYKRRHNYGRHYTFTKKGLEIVEKIKLKLKCKNTGVAKEAIISLNSELLALGENNIKILVLFEKMMLIIENTTLSEHNKDEILNDIAYIRFLFKKHGLEKFNLSLFDTLKQHIGFLELRDSIKAKLYKDIDSIKTIITGIREKQNLFTKAI